jgi:hypothetical protein
MIDYDLFDHSIHWFSILNSFMMVIFLCGLVLLILSRTIKTSITNSGMEKFVDTETASAAYRSVPVSPTTRELDAIGDETGWKLLVGDVFRAPSHLLLYSVLLGTGIQLFLLIFAALVMSVAVTYYDESRGLLTSLFLLFYSSGIQGYISGWYCKLHGGHQDQQPIIRVPLIGSRIRIEGQRCMTDILRWNQSTNRIDSACEIARLCRMTSQKCTSEGERHTDASPYECEHHRRRNADDTVTAEIDRDDIQEEDHDEEDRRIEQRGSPYRTLPIQ